MADFFDFIQKVKETNPIEDVVNDLGLKFERGSGRYRRVPHAGGLVVNVSKQRFFHATKGLNGDVIELVRMEKGYEPRTAIEWLARRANIEIPNCGRMSDEEIKLNRLKVNIFAIAQRLFQEWIWEDIAALEWVRGRGFTDESICADVTAEEALENNSPFHFSDKTLAAAKEWKKQGQKERIVASGAGFGFSGRRSEAQIKEMKDEFDLNGIQHDHPLAVTILGYMGNVKEWASKWNIDMKSDDWDERWEMNGRLHGMMVTPGIVFGHSYGGQVNYLSRRQLPGFEFGEDKSGKSFNPQRILAGPRQPYFNHVFRPDAEECILVEGSFDAESWAQWGWGAVGLNGVSIDDEGVSNLKFRLKHIKKLYIALDRDATGNAKREKVAAVFGPMTRLLDYSIDEIPEADDEANNEE